MAEVNDRAERMARLCPFGEWVSVESSNLSEVKYDLRMGFLWVRFHGRALDGTGEYCFVAVPVFRFRNLIRSQSVGRYFAKYIKTKYRTFREIQP